MKVFNLIFPDNCDELNINNCKIQKLKIYEKQIQKMDLVGLGGHNTVTATIETPEKDEQTLTIILILLSMFTGRKVFTDESNQFFHDPKPFRFGSILKNSLYPFTFEENVNKVYNIVSKKEWQIRYGDCIIPSLLMFENQPLKCSFIRAWRIWEIVYGEMTPYKMLNIMINLKFICEINEKYEDKIADLFIAKMDNCTEIVSQYELNKTMELFVEITEIVIANILQLQPYNIFNQDLFKKVDQFFESDIIIYEETLEKHGRLKWREAPKVDSKE